MIEVEIGNNTYNLPTSWSEVTLDKYEKILKMSSILNEYKSQLQFICEIFAILMNAPIDDVTRLSRESFEQLTQRSTWTQDNIIRKNKKTWTLDGFEWVAVEDMNKLTMGDNISLELMIKESTQENLIINILPMLIRKTVTKIVDGKDVKVPGPFNADEYDYVRQLFAKNLIIDEVLWIQDFFLDGGIPSSTTTKASSEKEEKKEKKMMK